MNEAERERSDTDAATDAVGRRLDCLFVALLSKEAKESVCVYIERRYASVFLLLLSAGRCIYRNLTLFPLYSLS